jgi:hypothetical protein
MSIIHINQIADKIKKKFESGLDLKDISTKDADRESKILTRCLAAYAIYHFGECSETIAANSVTDGGDDNGIDAIYYSVQNKELLIVQSKWSKKGEGEPDSAEIGKFCVGVKDLLESNFDRFNNKVMNNKKHNLHDLKYKFYKYSYFYLLIVIVINDNIF